MNELCQQHKNFIHICQIVAVAKLISANFLRSCRKSYSARITKIMCMAINKAKMSSSGVVDGNFPEHNYRLQVHSQKLKQQLKTVGGFREQDVLVYDSALQFSA